MQQSRARTLFSKSYFEKGFSGLFYNTDHLGGGAGGIIFFENFSVEMEGPGPYPTIPLTSPMLKYDTLLDK